MKQINIPITHAKLDRIHLSDFSENGCGWINIKIDLKSASGKKVGEYSIGGSHDYNPSESIQSKLIELREIILNEAEQLMNQELNMIEAESRTESVNVEEKQ